MLSWHAQRSHCSTTSDSPPQDSPVQWLLHSWRARALHEDRSHWLLCQARQPRQPLWLPLSAMAPVRTVVNSSAIMAIISLTIRHCWSLWCDSACCTGKGSRWRRLPSPVGAAVTAGSYRKCACVYAWLQGIKFAGPHLQGMQEPIALQHRHWSGSACCDHVGIAAGGVIQVCQHSKSISAPPCILLRLRSALALRISVPCFAKAAQLQPSVISHSISTKSL